MKESMLEIKDLHVVYRTEAGEVKAVNDVALSVKKGDVLGIVGETGAGNPPRPFLCSDCCQREREKSPEAGSYLMGKICSL